MTFKELKPALFLAVSVLFATVVFSYKAGEKSALYPEPTATKTEIQASSEEIVENEPSEEKSQETVVAENFFALLVGVGDYLHSCEYLPDLVYTCSDVLKVKRALTEKIGVPEENIRTLTTLEDDPAKRPTRENIENGLGWLEDKSRSGSAALAMFAGHGFETKNGEAAFAPEDVELYANGVLKAETATSATALAKRLQGVDAEFKILIVDACRTPAGVDGKLGTFVAPPSFARLNKAGLAFAQSCNVGESSYETSELDGGVFTHFWVEGLNGRAREEDGRVTFWGVAGYAAKKTSEYVKKRAEAEKNKEEREKIFKTLQTPTYTAIGYQDFNLRESKAELLYREGRALAFGLDGTVVDGVRGFQLLTEATEEGSLEAQAELAELYLDGCEGTPSDTRKAVELAFEPARQGNPFAQRILADEYDEGNAAYLEPDYDKRKEWKEKYVEGLKELSASEGDARAAFYIGKHYELWSNEEEYIKEATRWYRLAAERKYPAAISELARRYYEGIGCEKNEEKARELWKQAFEQNERDAARYLGKLSYGEDDYEKAAAFFARAAKAYSPTGAYWYGRCLRDGEGVDQNYEEAARLFKQAAEQGSADAMYALGVCYREGKGVSKSLSSGAYWLKRAAKRRHPGAIALYGYCLEKGEGGVEKNETHALWEYVHASTLGNVEATRRVGLCKYNGVGCKRDYDQAFAAFKKAASKGDEIATVMLGECYKKGRGTKQDYSKALECYRRAAEAENALGMANLGMCYYEGKGVERDYDEAVKWFRKAEALGSKEARAALGLCRQLGIIKEEETLEKTTTEYQIAVEKGETGSAFVLGALYELGLGGVKKDYEKAAKLYRQDAEQGVALAMDALGKCYYNGNGVEQDYVEAVNWFRKAEDKGTTAATVSLGVCYYYGNGVKRDYDEAVKRFRVGVDAGDTQAMCHLGNCYLHGYGVEKSYDEAVAMYRKAVEMNSCEGMNSLGRCYQLGRGVERDYAKAVELYRKAAEKKIPSAVNNLGLCYQYGWGVERDYDEAVRLFREAIELNSVAATSNLGVCYYDGTGVEQDYSKAVELYRKAAEENFGWAMCNLGRCYENGNGVEKNLDEAKRWYRKATLNDDEEASAAAEKYLERLNRLENASDGE